MFCIHCFHKNTKVTNSRPSKKSPAVWRRRACTRCGITFTTYERPSLADNKPIHLENGSTESFNQGKLIISIAGSFSHAPDKGKYDALWLAQTVEDTLSSQQHTITSEDIAAATHQTLLKYDELAAMQYAARYGLITSTTKRRGRA